MHNIKHMETHDDAYKKAVAAGCTPKWYDGMMSLMWHCDCPDATGDAHFIDQQCSVVKFYKLDK